MPVRSQAQRGYLNAHFGHAWVKKHGFDQKGKLPEHVHHKTVKKQIKAHMHKLKNDLR